MHPVELPIPGIQDIKWVELYDKFQLLVPSENNADWFYFTTPPPTVTHEWVKGNQKKAKDTRTQSNSHQLQSTLIV